MNSGSSRSNNNSNYTADSFINTLIDRVFNNQQISFKEASTLFSTADISALAEGANTITRKFNGEVVDIESLINAKSGRCPEDCSFCAQSSFYNTGISKYPLLSTEKLIEHARKAKNEGVNKLLLSLRL